MKTTLLDAIDLCAGPGGWDVAATQLGIQPLGFEIDEAAILTRDAAGHQTATVECEPSKAHPRGVRGLSMTEVDPADYPSILQLASPPCQGFSMAGTGAARRDSMRLVAALDKVESYDDVVELIADAQSWMAHEGTVLVLEPLRWALRVMPEVVAWEQVPAVLPLWEACARVLRRFGYSVATGCLQAEMFGVPQTRKRAILVARSAKATRAAGRVALPEPTHSRYHTRTPDKIDAGMPRWVSMAEALGWGATERPTMTVTGGGTSAGGAEPFGNAARQGLIREQDAGRWDERPAYLVPTNDRPNVARRAPEQPAPTMAFGHERPRWVHDDARPDACPCDMFGATIGQPGAGHRNDASGVCEWYADADGTRYNAAGDPILDGSDAVWETRPATTLVSSFRPDVVAGPGYRKPGDGPRQNAAGSVRVTVAEAAVLQSFPVDYPWQGTKTKQFQQVGNAIPPLLAEAVLCAVLGLPFDPSPGECSCE